LPFAALLRKRHPQFGTKLLLCAFLFFLFHTDAKRNLTRGGDCSYTTEATGHLIIKVWDHDKWISDDFLGEVAIPVKGLRDGKPVDEWYQLSNEPKKTKDKNPNRPPGEIHIRMVFPLKGVDPEKPIASEPKPAKSEIKESRAEKKMRCLDKYTLGKELGRYVSRSQIFSLINVNSFPSKVVAFPLSRKLQKRLQDRNLPAKLLRRVKQVRNSAYCNVKLISCPS